jgi:hypothetical protein
MEDKSFPFLNIKESKGGPWTKRYIMWQKDATVDLFCQLPAGILTDKSTQLHRVVTNGPKKPDWHACCRILKDIKSATYSRT